MLSPTLTRFDHILLQCRKVFSDKMHDYGTSWRILRTPSLTDQIFIKAKRIRSIEEKGTSQVSEGIAPEFIGMINYSLMALIQLEMGANDVLEMDPSRVLEAYDKYTTTARELLSRKNHDYGEAWRDMRLGSFTDIILMKLLRIKQIEDKQGVTLASEGIDANYYDIINYSVFALIMLEDTGSQGH
ncbi:MAG: DUF1599 domain-containing protein [Bacteroidales bacterium]|nr:DUF1599 domain-containing protein [Bacteroidales bacterium]MDZ4205545.1 DUF1599 domain-containing protein [Bacteroidales bacterium]